MLVLFPVLVLLVTPALMLALWRYRPNLAYQWLLAAAGALIAWVGVLFLRTTLPRSLDLALWPDFGLQYESPRIIADMYSWPFAVALATLVFAVVLTDLGHRTDLAWRLWAGALASGAVGILAVFAANPLTLALAWAFLDFLELFISLRQVQDQPSRQGVIINFATNLVGIFFVVWAGIVAASLGSRLEFNSIPPQVSIFLLIAVGLRLGIFPIYMPFKSPHLRRGLGSLLRLIPAATGLVLLARVAVFVQPSILTTVLMALTWLAAVYGGIFWVRAGEAIAGRPYWILTMTALAVGAALRGLPGAAIAYGTACLYGGGLMFFSFARKPAMKALFFIGMLGLLALPFSPSLAGGELFAAGFNPLAIAFLLPQALVLLGFARHAMHPGSELGRAERWVWVVYPLGLALLPLTHFAAGVWFAVPIAGQAGSPPWWPGVAAVLLAAGGGFLIKQQRQLPPNIISTAENVFSLDWLFRSGRWAFNFVAEVIFFLTRLLEGEGGMLWALLLLTLLVSLLTQVGAGG
ncbi:MAG: hypothetical protein OEZ02_10040 [Anaerolineae bacterium]|nr:hypothetical protein [Anaerolineae bacterium]